MPRQKLGQHFLSNPAWRQRIAHTLPADVNATWIEVGAGHGEMTEFLAQRSRCVIAIETDPALAANLRQRATSWSNVEIAEGDILAADLAALLSSLTSARPRQGMASAMPKSSAAHAPSGAEVSLETRSFHHDASQRFRVYGNLPYYITSPILRHLFTYADQIDSIHVVVQLEVAERIAARPGGRDYGYLSVLCQYYARPEISLRIPPGAFSPPPKVSSALVTMHLPGQRASLHVDDDAAFLKFLQRCFAQKRKTLRNNLKAAYSDLALGKALASAGFDAKARAEELTLPQFANLFARLRKSKNS
jgi:16S rRNA (adenine1518-N6/adenine1519-N6)-dimethyltransferase